MTREEAIEFGNMWLEINEDCKDSSTYAFFQMAIKALKQEPCDDTGEISDGYHTFNQLYHQRAILFATIVNQNTDIAWKSYKHSDGKYCFDSNREWFIVGVDTPEGSYTYHYSKEYWNYFKCKELDCGKEWDGHTEEDVTRLLSLKKEPCEDAISRQAVLIELDKYLCGVPFDEKGIDEVIKELPPVIPQPKTGYWIKNISENGITSAVRCSECGFEDNRYILFRYCPNCRARMVESQESEE